ncbi:hypothetical protein [Leptospira sp. GIMC2001]|uniref:hypothetical protein n=1 Tax=Leptospira sp. GIMC2001 TaxID=1513297 RepID=UPI00234B52AF|nr:hypothetical protein [Leptospira sp. GIMC2001]WCL49813.1 hypothetical protein O4O04_03065 [Leptospira sp. GIMC2001]
MKKISLVLILITTVFLTLDCSRKSKPNYIFRPATNPNTDLRKLEIDMIRIGDSVTKATAVLGKPTEKISTQNGTEMTWWFISTDYQEDSYQTLKDKPSDIEGVKFLKLIFDPKGIITAKEFEI